MNTANGGLRVVVHHNVSTVQGYHRAYAGDLGTVDASWRPVLTRGAVVEEETMIPVLLDGYRKGRRLPWDALRLYTPDLHAETREERVLKLGHAADEHDLRAAACAIRWVARMNADAAGKLLGLHPAFIPGLLERWAYLGEHNRRAASIDWDAGHRFYRLVQEYRELAEDRPSELTPDNATRLYNQRHQFVPGVMGIGCSLCGEREGHPDHI